MEEFNSNLHRVQETEQRNSRTANMDVLAPDELVRLLFEETVDVRQAVEGVLPQLTELICLAAQSVNQGGRIIYVGAGTSGRLGVLDASECPPTFSVSADTVTGVIAGGNTALTKAVEGAEDDEHAGGAEVLELKVNSKDVVIGIASSGKTPFVAGALRQSRILGAVTAVIVNVNGSLLAQHADYCLAAVTGPEPLTGSTRMRAGTAQKIILNLLSTSVMVLTGRVFGNLMVDVNASNVKLRSRAECIVAEAANGSLSEARQALYQTGWRCKPAIVMVAAGLDLEEAEAALVRYKGNIRACLSSVAGSPPKAL